MYLTAIDNFTLVGAAVTVTSIEAGLIFFIYALFSLFRAILLILELSMSMHLSFQVFFSLIEVYQINCNLLVVL